jgi:hypothetical protein
MRYLAAVLALALAACPAPRRPPPSSVVLASPATRVTPPSPLSEEAARALVAEADRAFEVNEMTTASGLYRQLTTCGRRWCESYALYKLAWAQWNQSLPQDALATLVRLIAYLDPPRAGTSEESLRREAIRDLARFYASIGRADRAEQFLLHVVHSDEVLPALAALAGAYEDAGDAAAAATIEEVIQRRRAAP